MGQTINKNKKKNQCVVDMQEECGPLLNAKDIWYTNYYHIYNTCNTNESLDSKLLTWYLKQMQLNQDNKLDDELCMAMKELDRKMKYVTL